MTVRPEVYDQHVHSSYSPDSDEKLEAIIRLAIERGKKAVVTTDHFDYDCKCFKRDILIDMPSYTREVAQLQQKYDSIEILKGIEVGFRRDYLEQIHSYLQQHSFDLVLLSVHNNGVLDYSEDAFHELSVKEIFSDYFGRVMEAVEQMDNYNVVAHLDYFVRYGKQQFRPQDYHDLRFLLSDILQMIIKKEKVLELNTAGLFRQGWIHPHPYILDMYLDLGGKLFSLGSDAHQISQYEKGFNEAIQLLQSYNIREVVQFRKRVPRLVSL